MAAVGGSGLSRAINITIALTSQNVQAGVAAVRAQIAAMRAEVDKNEKAFTSVGKGFLVFAKGAAVLSALSGGITFIAATTAALQNLLPIVLLAPAGLLALGAAFATFKIATAGFADAVKSGDLSKLSPQAAAAATAVRALGPAFDVVKRAVQDRFFANFSADIEAIGAKFLPILLRQLPKIADGFNAMGRSLAFALTAPGTGTQISIILANTAKLINNARNSLGAFAAGFITLGSAGSTYLPRIGTAIDGVAQRFERFANRITTDGSFDRFVGNAIQGFRDLFNIIGDVTAVVGLIFSGLAGPQGNVLGSLRETTEALRAFFELASTQTALGALGDALRAVSDAVRGVLLAALRELAPIIENLAPVVAEVARVLGSVLVVGIGIVGPLIQGLTAFMREHKEIVALVAEVLFLLYLRFLLFKGIAFVAALFSRIGLAIGGMAAVLRVFPLLALAGIALEIDKVNIAAAGGNPDDLKGMAADLHEFAKIIGGDFSSLKDPIGDITGELQTLTSTWDKGQAPIQENTRKFVDTTKASFDEVGRNIQTFIDTTKRSFDEVGTNISGFFTRTGESFKQIGTFIDEAVRVFQEFPGKVATAIGEKAGEIWTTFIEGATREFEPVRAFFAQTPYQMGEAIGRGATEFVVAGVKLLGAFLEGCVLKFAEVNQFFIEAPGKLALAIGGLVELLRTKATESWEAFRAAAQAKIDATVAEAQALPGKIGTAISTLVTLLRAKATESWESFKAATIAKLVEVVAYIATIPGKIIAIFNPLPAQTGQKGTETGTGFKNGLTTAFEAAIAYVRGIPGAIVSALGNVGNLLVTQGRAILDGLTAGMREGYQALLDFASGIAAGIAAVKGPLSYDRRVLTPAGLALMSGLRAGMETGYADVRRFASGIAGDLASTIDTGTIIAGASAAATRATAVQPTVANPTVDLLQRLVAAQAEGQQVHVYIGETELTQLVDTQVSTANRSTARTVRAGAGNTY